MYICFGASGRGLDRNFHAGLRARNRPSDARTAAQRVSRAWKETFTHGTLSQDIQKSGCRATRLRRTGYGCQWESGAGVPGVHQPTLQLDAPVVGVRKDAVLDAADVLVEGAAGLAALGAGRHQIGAGNLGGLKHRLVGD